MIRDIAPRRGAITLAGRGPGLVATLEFGPPDRPVDLVFLHANGFNALTYRTLLAPLGANLRILAFDQRGHGRTSLAADPHGRFDWHDLRDDLLALLEAANITRPVLAGHSMGATASLLAAERTPASARRLVLLDPVIGPPVDAQVGGAGADAMVRAALRRRSRFPSRDAAVHAYVGRGAFATWPIAVISDFAEDGFSDHDDGTVELACAPAWEASSYASQAHDTWSALRSGACPVHILRAERNSTCHVEGQIEDLTATGRIRIETTPGTSHFLPMERPDVARAALLKVASF